MGLSGFHAQLSIEVGDPGVAATAEACCKILKVPVILSRVGIVAALFLYWPASLMGEVAIVAEGAYDHLRLYVTMKLLDDWDQDVDVMLGECYRLFYGPAEKPMRAFFEGIENTYFQPRAVELADEYGAIDPDVAWTKLCPPKDLKEFGNLIEQARGALRCRSSADIFADYLYFHGLSVESAEALAELWHKRIREELGIAGADAAQVTRLFHQGYQGSRFSFGYPACPDLEDQTKLFELLDPARINVELTEEFQLDPEQSTSAIIVHHPEAKYFSIE